MSRQRKTFPVKKVNYFSNMNELLDENEKILIVGVDNVTSAQVQTVRMALRGIGSMLLGKNTMMKKVLELRKEKSGSEKDKVIFQKLVQDKMLQGNVGLIFTNGDLAGVKKILSDNRVQAPARQGAVAPCDVTVPAGSTGLEPTKTSFFQALNIGTKITKGTVEILKDMLVVKKGERVLGSEATLLQMLDIKPFFYGIEILNIFDNGSVYGPWVLDVTDDDLRNKVSAGIANLTAFALGVGIPTKASFPHSIINAFKNALAISVATDYDFTEFGGDKLKKAILSGPAPGAVAAASSGAAAAGGDKKAEKPKEDEPEEDDDMGMGLFD